MYYRKMWKPWLEYKTKVWTKICCLSWNSLVILKTDSDAFNFFRKNLYVWSLASGELMKVLDAHFGRIIALEPLIIGNWNSVSNGFCIDMYCKDPLFKQVFTSHQIINSIFFCWSLPQLITPSAIIWCRLSLHQLTAQSRCGTSTTYLNRYTWLTVMNCRLIPSACASQLVWLSQWHEAVWVSGTCRLDASLHGWQTAPWEPSWHMLQLLQTASEWCYITTL